MAEHSNSIKNANNFQRFMKFQTEILNSVGAENVHFYHKNKGLAFMTLGEMFQFLEEHFDEFYDVKNLHAVIPFIHHVFLAKNWDKCSYDVGLIFLYFLEKHTADEKEITIAVQIINRILYFLKFIEIYKDMEISGQAFIKLTEMLPTIKDRHLVSEIISCLQKFIEIYPDNRCYIISMLWSDLSQRLVAQTSDAASIYTEIQILVHMYDEFYKINQQIVEDPAVIATIQQLLRSEQQDKRKIGYCLCRKMIGYLVIKLNLLSNVLLTSSHIQQIEHLWLSYINLLENLEGEQSYEIIIIYLENLKDKLKSKELLNSWLEILCIRLLTHGNIKVLYWIMEYLLKTFTYSDLNVNIIKQLLNASNTMFLYNSKEEYSLDSELFKNFLKDDVTQLIELMGDIEWKSVPLYMWIKAIYDSKKELSSPIVTYEQLLKLSQRVCNLECWIMCDEIIKLFDKLFKKMIDNMSMREYITYVEKLYNTKYYLYNDFDMFYDKMSNSLKTNNVDFTFSQRFYEIFVKNLSYKNVEVNKLMKVLNELPKQLPNWFIYLPYHYYGKLNYENIEKLIDLHGINTHILKKCHLNDIITMFTNFVLPYNFEEDEFKEALIHGRIAAIAFYMQQKDSFDQEDDVTLKVIFNSKLSKYNNMLQMPDLWSHLCECLQNTSKKLEMWIINEFFKRICYEKAGDKILKYLCATYDENTRNKYFEIILDKYSDLFHNSLHNYVNPLKLSNQSHFFEPNLEKDENRIEQLFCDLKFNNYVFSSSLFLTRIWLNSLQKYCDEEYILHLLNYHKELSEKKPINDENLYSIKLKIAVSIYWMQEKNIYTFKIFNDIWNILLSESNESNICYIYEYIIGSYDTRIDTILDKLKRSHSLTSRQQMSIISVVHTYCMRRPLESNESRETVITNLNSYAMSDNSETRILAQKSLYKLLKTDNFKNVSQSKQILQSLENVLATKINDNSDDFRLRLHENEFRKWLDDMCYKTLTIAYRM